MVPPGLESAVDPVDIDRAGTSFGAGAAHALVDLFHHGRRHVEGMVGDHVGQVFQYVPDAAGSGVEGAEVADRRRFDAPRLILKNVDGDRNAGQKQPRQGDAQPGRYGPELRANLRPGLVRRRLNRRRAHESNRELPECEQRKHTQACRRHHREADEVRSRGTSCPGPATVLYPYPTEPHGGPGHGREERQTVHRARHFSKQEVGGIAPDLLLHFSAIGCEPQATSPVRVVMHYGCSQQNSQRPQNSEAEKRHEPWQGHGRSVVDEAAAFRDHDGPFEPHQYLRIPADHVFPARYANRPVLDEPESAPLSGAAPTFEETGAPCHEHLRLQARKLVEHDGDQPAAIAVQVGPRPLGVAALRGILPDSGERCVDGRHAGS